jgi:hypothetical protein
MQADLTYDERTPTGEDASSAEPAPNAVADLLVCLPGMTPDALQATLAALAEAFAGESLLIASPDPAPSEQPVSATWLAYATNRACLGWTLAAADYLAATKLAAEHPARAILLLGYEMPLERQHLRGLVECVRSHNADLAVPRFALGPTDALVNAAILYPLTRALFSSDIHFPLPVDAALSQRMAARLIAPAQHLYSVGQGDGLLWPVAEAAIAGFAVREVEAPAGSAPPPPTGEFNTLFNGVLGHLFSDIDAKANFWQRARNVAARPVAIAAGAPESEESASEMRGQAGEMIESFRLAQANLQEIWSLVLPPQSRLALKKLSLAEADAFHMDPALWARIVYDFALAFHLRTLNRGHLLGALTPLYLAWAASQLSDAARDPAAAMRDLEETAAAFDREKPYIVSRWRWPDRFNP